MTISKDQIKKAFVSDTMIDSDAGYKSENQYEVGYNILMEYFDYLPDDDKESIHKRLQAVGI